MSVVKVQGNASGTGSFTIAAPATNTDRTLTLPDATGTVQVSGNPISGTTGSFSGNVTFGSSVLTTPSGSAPSYLCRAWVSFNGTGTIAINASGNVSSISDIGVGNYVVNFTTAMPDTSYSVAPSTCDDNTAATVIYVPGTKANGYLATGSCGLYVVAVGGALTDRTQVFASFFR